MISLMATWQKIMKRQMNIVECANRKADLPESMREIAEEFNIDESAGLKLSKKKLQSLLTDIQRNTETKNCDKE